MCAEDPGMLRAKRALSRRWASWVIALTIGAALALAEDLLASAPAPDRRAAELSTGAR
jgi:hypothetical protein